MIQVLLVALGGAVGAVLRYLTGLVTIRVFGKSKVITGTVIANCSGCLIAGILLAWFSISLYPSESIYVFFTIGILGSYTTFSTFSLEISRLLKEPWRKLVAYLFLQMIVAIGLTALGYYITIWIAGGVHG